METKISGRIFGIFAAKFLILPGWKIIAKLAKTEKIENSISNKTK